MANDSLNFDKTQFLTQYWQKQPAVLNGFFPQFEDLIDEHDLAGIAQEDHVDSRIVSQNAQGEWTNTNGPFDDFNAVCIDAWTLLVQGVERYIDSIDDLFEQFAFLPYWRMDDVMVSYSVKGAGVGAHIDQYDVFLIQGKGQRRWQIGKPSDYEEIDNNGLRQIAPFEPIIDVVTQQGDVLYIPPGWPHKGETIEDSLTYSIGFRAPDSEQLVNVLHDVIDDNPAIKQRFSDPKRSATDQPALVTNDDLSQLKAILKQLIDSADFEHHLLSMLSDYQSAENELAETIDIEKLTLATTKGCVLKRAEGVRPIYRAEGVNAQHFEFYINGKKFSAAAEDKPALEGLLNARETHFPVPQLKYCTETFYVLLGQLIENGYFYIE